MHMQCVCAVCCITLSHRFDHNCLRSGAFFLSALGQDAVLCPVGWSGHALDRTLCVLRL